MQHYQVQKQEREDAVDCSANPSHDEGKHILAILFLGGENGYRDDVKREMNESADDHDKERAVVEPSYAVIDPHAMMIEVLDASRLFMKYRSHALQCRDFSFT